LDYLYGAHAVEAALSFNFRKNLDLFVQMNFRENTPDNVQRIIELAQSKNVKVKYLVRDKMDRFTGGRPHNGLVLKSQPREYIFVSNFGTFVEKFVHKKEGNLLILLDQIVDPQNFGSVIRSAFFLGSDAVLMNKNNKPPLSATVCKVSSGASECLDLFAVKNIRKFLNQAINTKWTVVTTSIEKDHDVQLRISTEKPSEEKEIPEEEQISQNKTVTTQNISLTELNIPKGSNVILVLGSEANGIISDLSGVSNYNVHIPPLLNKELIGKHPFNIIDSLNVGVSAGIIINHIKASLKGLSAETREDLH
jgi:21S rRNA (GM2251-2'-O)-methyltransferase